MFDDHPFAFLAFFKALSVGCLWELKCSKSFVLRDLASKCFVFGYQVDALERSVKGRFTLYCLT